MLLRRSFTVAATISIALTSTSSLASECWDPVFKNSIKMHSLNTMLLVGALKCRSGSPDVLDNYYKFANLRRQMLAENSFLVSAHFINMHGSNNGKIAFINYESKVANLYSGRVEDPVSCARIGAYSRLAAQADESDLIELANAVAALAPVECTAQPVVAIPATPGGHDTFDLEPPGSGYASPAAPPAAVAAERQLAAPPAAAPEMMPAAPSSIAAVAEQPMPGRGDQAITAAIPTEPLAADQVFAQRVSLSAAEPTAAPATVSADQPVNLMPAATAPTAAEALAEAARALAQAAAALQKSSAAKAE